MDVPGFASIIVSTLALSGLILLQLGLMGLYLGRIYEEVKGRPLYLVRDLVSRAAAENAGALTHVHDRHVRDLV